MKRFPLFFTVLCLLSSWSAAAYAATLTINNNHYNFGEGDNITTTVKLAHNGSPVSVDVYLVLVLPDQTMQFYSYDNGLVSHTSTSDPATWVKLVSNLLLTDGFDSGQIILFNYTMTGQEAEGIYEWKMAVVGSGTLNIMDLKTSPFFVSTGPVGPLLGTYDVTTFIPSLGASGTATLVVSDSAPGELTISASSNSAGFTSSFTGTGQLDNLGGIRLTMQADIFGTQAQGSGYIDADGNISGNISVQRLGPFIKSINDISGTFSNGVINATESVLYTDGTSGTEYFTAVHR
ncbi:MAG: hypothetical protein V2B19_01025 [Pseudomonadota bacterium]